MELKRLMQHRAAGIGLIVFVMIVWGSAFAVTKAAIVDFPPFTFAFIRFAIAALCLYLYKVSAGRTFQKLDRKMMLFAVLLGLTGVTLYYVFFNLALLNMPASVGALTQGFIPVCVTLLAVTFLKEKLNIKQIAGIILSVTGVVVLGWGGMKAGNASLSGLLLMGLSVVSWSVYTIMSKKLSAADSFTITFYTTLFGFLFLIPFTLWELPQIHLQAVTLGGWLAVFYLGAIGSALSYFLYNRALDTLSAAQVGNFMNLDPIIGCVIAIVFLNEKLSVLQIAGSLLVIAGIVLSSFKRAEV